MIKEKLYEDYQNNDLKELLYNTDKNDYEI